MPVKLFAESLPKNQVHEPMTLTKPIGAAMEDDPITTFASKIEAVSTRAEIEAIIKNHVNAVAFDRFKLGGAIEVARVLFAKSHSEFADYKNFREYVENHGLCYSNAMRYGTIYRKLVDLDIPWSAFEAIGWTKVLILLDVVTKDNIKAWVAKAKEMNFHSLEALVKAEKQMGKAGIEQKPKAITTKTFKLHQDQKEIVEDALAKAREETGSVFETVNLEAICQSYLGDGLKFSNWEQALSYAKKQVNNDPAFYATVREFIDLLCPTAAMTFKAQELASEGAQFR
jgi:hypothetical protein